MGSKNKCLFVGKAEVKILSMFVVKDANHFVEEIKTEQVLCCSWQI